MISKKNKKYETILLERIENKIGLLAEGQSVLREKVDSLEVKVDSLVEDMDEVKARLTSVEEEVKEVNIKLDKKADEEIIEKHEKRLVKLENVALAKA